MLRRHPPGKFRASNRQGVSYGGGDSNAAVWRQPKEKAQEVAGQAQEKAQQAAGQAREKLREQVNQRSAQAGEQLTSAAQDIRTVAAELGKQGKHKPAQLADQAAERAERLGNYLKESDADRILADIEDLVRKQPSAVVAGGLALGFLASRFLRPRARSAIRRRQVSPLLLRGCSDAGGKPSDQRLAGPSGR
jgi:hypothetical protein